MSRPKFSARPPPTFAVEMRTSLSMTPWVLRVDDEGGNPIDVESDVPTDVDTTTKIILEALARRLQARMKGSYLSQCTWWSADLTL